jgi:hypothetical protein
MNRHRKDYHDMPQSVGPYRVLILAALRVLICTVLAASAAAPLYAKGCGADVCVGPAFALKRPSEAAAVAKDGQSIGIAAGVYDNDVAVWRQHNLIIRGIGGHAHVRVDGISAESKAIWVIKGNNATIEHIEFSGARVPHMNGAGIRLEGTHLTLRHCYFHHNQTGLLTGKNTASDILIEHSEFAGSGAARGNPHAIYIGEVRSFTLRFSYVHHARVGHNVKSRALRNYILYNRIMDEADGEASYAIDLPNGGIGIVLANLIQQGPRYQNDALIAFGAERARESHPVHELYVVNNTLVNDTASGRFVFSPFATDRIMLVNNIFSGPGAWFTTRVGDSTAPIQLGNVALDKSEFADAAAFDYRLRAKSKAIDAGVPPGSAHGFDLTPVFEYVHKARSVQRQGNGVLDAGALEFAGR